MRLAFLGTPAASVPALRALVKHGHEVVVVITAPDRRRGRGGATSPTPVKAAARELGLVVAHDLETVVSSNAELGVVVAFGSLISKSILDQIPMMNVHFSLLPRWRGAAPVERAILAGDQQTGVCVMGLEVSLDTGPVFARATTNVGKKSAAELTTELAELGADLLCATLSQRPLPSPIPQSGDVIYAHKITRDDLALTPALHVDQLHRIVRLGRAHATVANRQLLVVRAEVVYDEEVEPGVVRTVQGEPELGAVGGYLRLLDVRPAGARTMTARSWWQNIRERNAVTWGAVANDAP